MLRSPLLISLWYQVAREWTAAYFQKSILTTIATRSRHMSEEQGVSFLHSHIICLFQGTSRREERHAAVWQISLYLSSLQKWFLICSWYLVHSQWHGSALNCSQLFFWPIGRVLLIKTMTKWKWWFLPVQMEFHRLENPVFWIDFLLL